MRRKSRGAVCSSATNVYERIIKMDNENKTIDTTTSEDVERINREEYLDEIFAFSY